MRRILTLIFCTQVLAIAVASAADPPDIRISAAPPIVKACSTAYHAFERELQQFSAGADDLGIFMSSVDNYQIRIYSEAETLVVEFAPKPFNGVLVRGGVVKYEIDPSGEEILNIKRLR